MFQQLEIRLPAFRRGYHLITRIVEKELPKLPEKGLVNIFVQHTSAALSINENADPSVRVDFESFMNKLIPENDECFTHIFEGSDDMPAHLKAAILGTSVSIPISNGALNMGTWQGIYLCEFRNNAGARKLTISILS